MLRQVMLSVAGLAALGACASATTPAPQETFQIVEENAAIDSVMSVQSVQRRGPGTVLIRANTGRWYKAEVNPKCAAGATGRPGGGYPLETTADGRVDTFTRVAFDDLHKCKIQKLDRIETPQHPHG